MVFFRWLESGFLIGVGLPARRPLNGRTPSRKHHAMDVRTLSTFCVAARTLSFTNAAATLGCAQSSVTAQMKSLEEDLGSALFNRVGNRLELTGPGQRFLIYAERILALAQEAKDSVLDPDETGTVRFTAPETICTYLLPPLLMTFKARYPRVRVQFLPGFVRDFKRNVLEGAADLAFVLEEPFPSKVLAMEKLRDEQILIVARARAPAGRGRGRLGPGHHGRGGAAQGPRLQLPQPVRAPADRRRRPPGRASWSSRGWRPSSAAWPWAWASRPCPGSPWRPSWAPDSLVALPWEGQAIRISTYAVWNPERHMGFAEKAFLRHVREQIAVQEGPGLASGVVGHPVPAAAQQVAAG